MKAFRADLHLHTVLSPCGDLEMSPARLVEQAHLLGLNIIGITHHNSTKHAPLVEKLANKKGIFTLCGAEVTSKEEVHLLCFMPNEERLKNLQNYIDEHLKKIPNKPNYFGEQLLVNEKEEILNEEPYLLINALDQDVDEISAFVYEQGGIFIPAHIDRATFSLTSQLGFVPPDLKCHAYEISKHTTKEQMIGTAPYLKNACFIQSSDAHYITDVASAFSVMHLEELTFDEIKKALAGIDGRFCTTLAQNSIS